MSFLREAAEFFATGATTAAYLALVVLFLLGLIVATLAGLRYVVVPLVWSFGRATDQLEDRADQLAEARKHRAKKPATGGVQECEEDHDAPPDDIAQGYAVDPLLEGIDRPNRLGNIGPQDLNQTQHAHQSTQR